MTDVPSGASETDHRNIPGSHERPFGPECRCGARWDGWVDRCMSTVSLPAPDTPADRRTIR